MEKLLNEQVVSQISQTFEQMKEPVQILFFGSQDNCEYCTDTVSYTHLRAHETVLDIVCRLLLGKQKKKHK